MAAAATSLRGGGGEDGDGAGRSPPLPSRPGPGCSSVPGGASLRRFLLLLSRPLLARTTRGLLGDSGAKNPADRLLVELLLLTSVLQPQAGKRAPGGLRMNPRP